MEEKPPGPSLANPDELNGEAIWLQGREFYKEEESQQDIGIIMKQRMEKMNPKWKKVFELVEAGLCVKDISVENEFLHFVIVSYIHVMYKLHGSKSFFPNRYPIPLTL